MQRAGDGVFDYDLGDGLDSGGGGAGVAAVGPIAGVGEDEEDVDPVRLEANFKSSQFYVAPIPGFDRK